jgi:repressor LexA
MALTRRQKQVLDFLVDFINKRGYSPSFEEIGKGLKLSSLATVHKHLQTLAKKGFVRRGYNQSRSLEVVAVPGSVPFAKTAVRPFGRRLVGKGAAAPERAMGGPARPQAGGSEPAMVLGRMEFPLLGLIAAGRPVEAISNPETLSLADFADGKGGVYVLKVKGDSMVEDHICDGDFILVEGVETAENGEIVVALTGGTDATLKRFYRESNGRVRLQPANSQMEALILAAREVKIQGRVIGVLRKY